MPIDSENHYAERSWTGVETSFNPTFAAEDVAHVKVVYRNSAGALSTLTRGTHFNAALDGGDNVTVTPVALPAATADAPGTLLIERVTPAVQETDFENLQDYDPATHTRLHDRAFRAIAEVRGLVARQVRPYVVAAGVTDFGVYRIKAANAETDDELVTRGYVLQITGVLQLEQYVADAQAAAATAAGHAVTAQGAIAASEDARDRAQLWSDQNEDTLVEPGKYSAKHHALKAAASAAIVLPYLTHFDDGLFGGVEDGTTDDGAFL